MASGPAQAYCARMLGIEYCQGESIIERETSAAPVVAAAYGKAIQHARKVGADKVRFRDARGLEIGVYPVPDLYRA
jgi:hypothetical protein